MNYRRRARTATKSFLQSHSAIVGSVVAVKTAAPHIVMTFDDGPDPIGTEQVLAALETHRATATFFVLMTRVRRYQTLLAEIAAAGHEVGLHGPDHQPLTDFRYPVARQRTEEARAELEDKTCSKVRWFRPPYGRQTPSTWRAVTTLQMTPVMWGATIWDWRDLPQSERIQKAQEGVAPGAIVLGHDAFAGASDGIRQQPEPVFDRADLVNRVLTTYEDQGLQGRSLKDALASGSLVKAARFSR